MSAKVPEGALWRRAAVKNFLGVTDQVVTDLVAAGELTPVYVAKGRRAFYKRCQVIKLAGPESKI